MSDRKKDHIDLALNQEKILRDTRFDYEPMLASLNDERQALSIKFANKSVAFPLWISSMTGGTEMAGQINQNLARAAAEFKLGFGLGSCRKLLTSDEHIKDFDLRAILGDDQPFYGNLGIAQLEKTVLSGDYKALNALENKLGLDGWIIHINPMQEWAQPEGDRWQNSPISTLKTFLKEYPCSVIVKEVGQGFGPSSLWELAKLPLEAIELAGMGGTNFTLIELSRQDESKYAKKGYLNDLAKVGHSSLEMLKMINDWPVDFKPQAKIIFSGGLKNALDGYYLMSNCSHPSLYAQAKSLLTYATGDYANLKAYLEGQVELFHFANKFLRARPLGSEK